MLTFRVLHDSVPVLQYLGPLVAVADLLGRRALRSASTNRLVMPPIKLSTIGIRAFPIAAVHVWNGLPESVFSSSPLQTFTASIPSPDFLTVWLSLLRWPCVGPGHPFFPLSLHFSVFCFFLLFPFLVGFKYFLLLSIPFLSTRIVPLHFQAGGRRKRPNLGLLCCVYFVLSVFFS